MSDVSPGTVANFLSTLRTLPVWLLGALAATGYAVLFFPGFGGVSPAAFRSQWGIAIWIATLAFSILTVARGVDSAIATYHVRRTAREARRALRLVPRHHQRWWHLAKQQDDSYGSQRALDIEIANVTDYPDLQSSRNCRHNLFTILRAFLPENCVPDSAAYLPIQHCETGIDSLCDLRPCSEDQLAHVPQQTA